MLSRLRSPLIPLLIVPLLTTCGGDGPSGPLVAAVLAIVSGDAQTAVVATALGQSLTVEARDDGGNALAGVDVAWSVATGDGQLSATSTPTDAQGRASVNWTLGTRAGAQNVTASSGSATARFEATATPDAPVGVDVSPDAVTTTSIGETFQFSAAVVDQFGNATGGDAFTWSSSDETVATVSTTGLVTAVAVGTATITATSGELSGTAVAQATQVVASITLDPDPIDLFVGVALTVTPTAFDAGGTAVGGGESFTYAASPAGLVQIDPATDGTSATLTGLAEGAATLTVTSSSALNVNATAPMAIAAIPLDFTPDVDGELGGQQTLGVVTIPAGVTVTVTEDLTLNATGDVQIDGTLTGDCVGIDIHTAGNLTLNGTVTNRCAVAPPTEAPGLTLMADQAWTVEDVTVESTGSILLSNIAPAPTASGVARATAAQQMAAPCRSARSNFSVFDNAPRGADGSPQGSPGGDGASVSLRCSGDAEYIASRFIAQGGGGGGTGTSEAAGVEAVGGRGGNGGNVTVEVSGNMTAGSDLSSLTLIPGAGGPGGTGTSNTMGHAMARGGDGGNNGVPRLIVGGTLTVFADGVILDLQLADAGRGGLGEAKGRDGADATDNAPAERGNDATARGGRGGNLAGAGATVNLLGDMVQAGSIVGQNNIVLRLAQAAPGGTPITGSAGNGGVARAQAGNGGDGNKTFKPGGNAGTSTAIGGEGGNANIFDNRGNVFVGFPGDGGEAQFSGLGIHIGGRGGDMCMFGMVGPGGPGGNGGTAIGIAGRGGFRGATREGQAGGVILAEHLNGGNGGDGDGPGAGGAAGDDSGVVVLNGQTILQPFKQPGVPGNPCKFNYDVGVDVVSDPNVHNPFVGMTNVTMLMLTLGADGAVTFQGDSPWVELTGTAAPDGSFSVSGRGVAAGFPGVLFTFEGTITVDENGVPTGFMGTLTVDAENAILPENAMGMRNPVVYTVSGTLKPEGM